MGRVLVALVVTAALGAAGGYAVAAHDEPAVEQRTTFADPAPMPATDPSLPVVLIEPDPDDPQLAIDVPLRKQRLVAPGDTPPKLRLALPVPVGWYLEFDGASRWKFTVPGNDENAYGLRVDILTGDPVTVDRAVGARESALRSAEAQGFLPDLEFLAEFGDGFTASYIDRGFRRISMERFYSGPDPTLAYATVVVYGRVQDQPGMADLLERISIGLRTN